MQAMNPADEDDGDLSGSEEADVTVVEGNSANVAKTTASEPPSHNGDITVASLELPVATIRVASAYMAFEKEDPPDELVRTLVKDSEALKLGLAATQTLTTLSGEAQQATTGRKRLIGLHIRSVMDSKQLSAAQHAYSKGKSTESALHAVVSQIEKSLNHKEYALAAFLDIEGAFNNVLPTAITESLTDLGVEIKVVELIHKLLMSRMVTSTLGISTQTSGALRTTPNEALNAILNLPSLDLAGMERAKIAAVRMRDLGQWKPQIYGHARILQQDTMIPPSTDLCKPIEYIHTPFEALLPTREDWEQGQPGPTEAVNFYTDGSKLNNQVGGAIYSEQLNIRKSFRLPDHCSVFQAEVFAIIEALMLLNDANCQNKLINIYSDSQAAIRSIISTNTNSHTISTCRKSLHEMALQFKIYLIWVPGHRNITGNCIADELARHGTTVPLLPD
ncbi:uncharacterized protein [Drosophila suzukii]|uniref:ribonuclease H n=1 Tax=Drosophila suzukii TaxID=28584 RepID=A0ABM4TXP5_DROSZ